MRGGGWKRCICSFISIALRTLLLSPIHAATEPEWWVSPVGESVQYSMVFPYLWPVYWYVVHLEGGKCESVLSASFIQ